MSADDDAIDEPDLEQCMPVSDDGDGLDEGAGDDLPGDDEPVGDEPVGDEPFEPEFLSANEDEPPLADDEPLDEKLDCGDGDDAIA
jgi:hypothetical protein